MNDITFCPFCGHGLISKFIEDRSRLFCEKCERPIYENPTPATAALVVNQAGELLLVKRSAEPKAGQWCLPGGFVELSESPEACCLRELKEETNLSGRIDRLIGVHLSENPVYKSVVVMGYSICDVHGSLMAGDDSEEADYFDLARLPPVAFQSHQTLIEEMFGSKMEENRPSPPRGADWGAYVISSMDHYEIIVKACRAGARIVQYRDKKSEKGRLLEMAKKIRDVTRQHKTRFILNDHVDVALLSGADGVHLGQDDISLVEARKITPPGFTIGISTHSLLQAEKAAAEGADYIGIGPVFATPTKDDYKPIGFRTVQTVLQRVTIPVVAIGGLTLENLGPLKRLGVKNVAMVRAFQRETEDMVRAVNREFFA